MIINKKRVLGQFFTKNHLWLKQHIKEFINKTGKKIAYDPYAGAGDLLTLAKEIGFKKIIGLDIDETLNWTVNDSLVNVPRVDDSIIITNPPYLSNYSAKRKKIYDSIKQYFDNTKYDNLYLIAIEKCLSNDYGIMIIPETFINTKFPKNRLVSITIIEEQLFNDTENPICVICYDNKDKSLSQVKVYKNSDYIGTLAELESKRLKPHSKLSIKFNDKTGEIALRAVDTTDPSNKIRFMKREEMNYDINNIKHSSRLITFIKVRTDRVNELIKESNKILETFRSETSDVLLSAFKGNMKNGHRRRRLDYKTARAILELAHNNIKNQTILV